MQRWNYLVAAIGVLSSGCQTNFTTVTYNTALLPQALSSLDVDKNAPIIAEKLREISHDQEKKHIVFAQEVFDQEYDQVLEKRADFPYETPRPEKPLMLGDGLKAFSDFEVISVIRKPWRHCQGYLEDYNDCLTPKGAAYYTIRLNNVDLVGVNVHFDAGDSPQDEEARILQLQQFIGDFNQIVGNRAAFVIGDFNTANEIPLGIMKMGTGLQDVCDLIACPEEGIDRVYFKNTPLVTLTPTSYSIDAALFTDEKSKPLSDHLPVVVDWNIKIGPPSLYPLIDHFSKPDEKEEEPKKKKGLEDLLNHK